MKEIKNILLGILLIIFCGTVSFAGNDLKRYNEKLYLDQNGNLNVRVEFQVKMDTGCQIKLPMNFVNTDKLESHNPGIKEIRIVNLDGVKYVLLHTFAHPDSMQTYIYSFGVKKYFDFEKNKSEFGNFIFSYKYINTCPVKIDKYESNIILPEGYAVSSVLETVPKVKNNNPESPYDLGRIDGRNFVKLNNSKMGLGENSFIKFRFKSEEKSKFLLVFLIVIAAAYLFLFRDLIIKTNKKQDGNII